MKRMNKILVLLLALIMIFGTMNIPVFATDEKDYSAEEVYTMFEKLPSVKEILSDYENRESTKAAIKPDVEAASAAYESLTAEEKAAFEAGTYKTELDKFNTLQELWMDYGYFTRPAEEQQHKVKTSSKNSAYVYQLMEVWHQISFQLDDEDDGSTDGPVTFVLVDGSKYPTWTANKADYAAGDANYDVTYCVDQITGTRYGKFYRRANLEDADYYNVDKAAKIRAITENSHPYISADKMIQNINEARKQAGQKPLDPKSIDEGQLVTATQMAIWNYSNLEGSYAYAKTANWRPSSYRSHLAPIVEYNMDEVEVAANINAIYEYLIALKPVYASNAAGDMVITDLTYKAYKKENNSNYDLYVSVQLNEKVNAKDNLLITVYVDEKEVAAFDQKQLEQLIANEKSNGEKFSFRVENVTETASVKVEISGTQNLEKGVYFYEPEGNRNSSQSMVGISSGDTPVSASADFKLETIPDYYLMEGKLKVSKEVIVADKPYKNNKVYYVTLFEDAAMTKIAEGGATKAINMNGEAEAAVMFDGLVMGGTYYVAETDANGNVLKDGAVGTTKITIDETEITLGNSMDETGVEDVTITNCYEDEEYFLEETEEETDETTDESDDATTEEEESTDEESQTGDDSNMTVYFGLMLAALAAMAVAFGARRRRN